MIQRFIDSWALFGQAYLVSLLCAGVLGLVGVVAVARRQVFIAASVSQASAFGFALVTFIAAVFLDAGAQAGLTGMVRDIVTVVAAVAAAFVTMLLGAGGQDGKRTDGDEMTAWVFIMSGACAELMLTNTPSGMEEYRRVQAPTVIGASTADVAVFGGLLFTGLVLLAMYWRELVLLLSDPVMAAAVGMKVKLWNVALALCVGLTVGLSVRSTGMVFTFGCVAFPAIICKQWCGQIKSLFFLAPVVAILMAFVGLWVSYNFKLPPGQVIVALLGTLALAAYAGRLMLDRVST